MRRKALTGQRRRRSSGARPLRVDAWVVVMASTGMTRTARHTGQAVARNGKTNPMAAPRTNMPGCHGVRHTGRGSMDLKTGRMAAITTNVMTTPMTAPARAIWAPTSRGRAATRRRDQPMAMPMPISRRCDSTMRLARLNAPNAAQARMRAARMFQNCWSPLMSS